MTFTRILEVTHETHDTISIRVPMTFQFEPGQFIMLGSERVPGVHREVRRSYSVSSAPNGKWLEVTVKKQEPGLFSGFCHMLYAGDKINVYGPFGKHFVWNAEKNEIKTPVVFVAGGSGIAPFRSMLEHASKVKYSGQLFLFYSVKTSQDIIFAKELTELAKSLNLTVHITLTRPGPQDNSWEGKLGRVGEKLLRDELPPDVLESARFFVCGPSALIDSVRVSLEALGVQKDRVLTENFGKIEG